MRVRMLSGVKRVTMIGSGSKGHTAVRESPSYSSSEALKFFVIRPTGQVEHGVLHLDLGPVKKSSRRLRPIERRVRKLIRAEYKALGRYLVLHERSRRKRRNGWAGDLGSNVVKVIRNRK